MVFVLGVPYAKKTASRFCVNDSQIGYWVFFKHYACFWCVRTTARRSRLLARTPMLIIAEICIYRMYLFGRSSCIDTHAVRIFCPVITVDFFLLCFSSSYNTKIPSRSYITNFIVYAGELAFMRSLAVIGTPMEKWWCSSNMCVYNAVCIYLLRCVRDSQEHQSSSSTKNHH